MPAEWQARQLLLTASAAPGKVLPGSGKSTLTERSVTPATATLEGGAAEREGSASNVGLVDTVTIAVARSIAPIEGPTVQACGSPDILMGFLLVWDQAMVS